jgi:hypothetical protein
MHAIMGNAQLLGMKLLQNQGTFGCFLHLYNMLAGLAVIDRIDALEALCDLFTEQVFPGNRPKKNFSSMCFRFQGCPGHIPKGVKFPTKARFEKMNNTTKMRLDPLKTSVFINQFYCSSRLDKFQCTKLAEGTKVKFSRSLSDTGKFENRRQRSAFGVSVIALPALQVRHESAYQLASPRRRRHD